MKWLTVAQAAEHIGYSKETVRRWIAQEKLAARRLPSGRIRIEAGELEALLKPVGGSPDAEKGETQRREAKGQ